MAASIGTSVRLPTYTIDSDFLASKAEELGFEFIWFADIDPETFNLDPNQVEAKITSGTKTIIPVDLYGHPADIAQLPPVKIGPTLSVEID